MRQIFILLSLLASLTGLPALAQLVSTDAETAAATLAAANQVIKQITSLGKSVVPTLNPATQLKVQIPYAIDYSPVNFAAQSSAAQSSAAQSFATSAIVESSAALPTTLPQTIGRQAPGQQAMSNALRAPAASAAGSQAPAAAAQTLVAVSGASIQKVSRVQLPALAPKKAQDYAISRQSQKVWLERHPFAFASPDLVKDKTLHSVTPKIGVAASAAQSVAQIKGLDLGLLNAAEVHGISWHSATPKAVLQKTKPLTETELKFLAALWLYENKQSCESAVPLFASLAKDSSGRAEASLYLARCAFKKDLVSLGYSHAQNVLNTDDSAIIARLIPGLAEEVPFESLESFGASLLRALDKKTVNLLKFAPEIQSQLAYTLIDYASKSHQPKIVVAYAPMVGSKSEKAPDAALLLGLAQYQIGDHEKAEKTLSLLMEDLEKRHVRSDLQPVVALNLGRVQFQNAHFKNARQSFLRVTKDHPLWMQSLTEMGWAQLQSGDLEGAIGNMYSLHSPYFNQVYKPESYVIRTIGYLKLCQYGDAYRILTGFEKQYRPWLESIQKYEQLPQTDLYSSVRTFVAQKGAAPVDALPSPVLRELARQKSFLNWQNAINHNVDEKGQAAQIHWGAKNELIQAQVLVEKVREKTERLKTELAQVPAKQKDRLAKLRKSLDSEYEKLNDAFFDLDIYAAVEKAAPDADTMIAGSYGNQLAIAKKRVSENLRSEFQIIKNQLVKILDNNELLRYEVFSGSGENLRFQVSGGETAHRVPASVMPKSKSLQWDFNGEYWEDEIGHYRSALKNNCAANAGAQATVHNDDGEEL